MEFDAVEKMGSSIVQHGPLNNRIYLLKLCGEDMPEILPRLDRLALREGYTKILAKVPMEWFARFQKRGYVLEAMVPGMIRGKTDAGFMGKFQDPDRRLARGKERLREVLELTRNDNEDGMVLSEALPRDGLRIECCGPADAEEMSRVYRSVFRSYPFPISDPGYVKKTMDAHVRYYCVRSAGRIVALASSEMDAENRNVEMTDFATIPDRRGQGLAGRLLAKMESDMAGEGMRTAFTIARALSPGMNLVFSRRGYAFSGALINNTHIAGGIESMNVWYKPLNG